MRNRFAAILLAVSVLGVGVPGLAGATASAAAPAIGKLKIVGGPAAGLGASHTVVYGIEAPTFKWVVTGGTAPYTWQVSEIDPAIVPGAPAGVWTLAAAGGASFSAGGTWEPLTAGNPVPGNYIFQVTATDKAGMSDSARVTVTATPAAISTVGVGGDATQFLLDQLAVHYNDTKPASSLYSFDASDPAGAAAGPIVTKVGCTAIPRPNSSPAGINALATENGTSVGGTPCIDFARSALPQTTLDPLDTSFLNLAGDAVTYATLPHAHTKAYPAGPLTFAPLTLTPAQLTGIYTCAPGFTRWNQVGGKRDALIVPVLPLPGSDTRAAFLNAIGVTTPGTCVLNGTDAGGNPIPGDEGIAPEFSSAAAPNLLVPFSVGAWLTEKYRDPSCFNAACTRVVGVACIPSPNQNAYGCDQDGPLAMNQINGIPPALPWNAKTGEPASTSVTNTAIPAPFQHLLYDVVDAPAGTQPAGALATLFGPAGWACTNATADTDLRRYGFIVLPVGAVAGDCGFANPAPAR